LFGNPQGERKLDEWWVSGHAAIIP
jgi:hypothetical protein